VIPESTFGAIQNYLRERTEHAEGGWDAGADEEDTLTGDFGASLRTRGWIISGDNRTRSAWRVTYTKFRGRGPRAPEKETGADGIFQIEVYPSDAPVLFSKGVLFQAKKYQGSSRGDLIEQVEKMEQIASGGTAVFEFGPQGYRGSSGREILAANELTATRIPHPERALGNYLADSFLPCESGLRGMYFDAERGNLVVPEGIAGVKLVRIRLKERIALQVINNFRR